MLIIWWYGSYRAADFNLLRFEDHLQLLSLGRRPPLKIVPRKIDKNWSVCMFITLKANLCSQTIRQISADHQCSTDHRLRTAAT